MLSRGGSAGGGSLTRSRSFGSLLCRSKFDAGATRRIGQRTARQAGFVRGVVVRRSCPSFVLVAEVGRRCLTVGSGSGCGWSRGGRSSRARETAIGEPVSRKGKRLSGRKSWKERKLSCSMEGVSVRGNAPTFTGRRGKRAWSAVTAGASHSGTADDGDIRSLTTVHWRGPNKSSRRTARRAEARIGRVIGPTHPRVRWETSGSPGSPHEARVLVFDMWVAEVGRTHLWRSVRA
jgi:hypothetical protein